MSSIRIYFCILLIFDVGCYVIVLDKTWVIYLFISLNPRLEVNSHVRLEANDGGKNTMLLASVDFRIFGCSFKNLLLIKASLITQYIVSTSIISLDSIG